MPRKTNAASKWTADEIAAVKRGIRDSAGFVETAEAVNRITGTHKRTVPEVKDKWIELRLQQEDADNDEEDEDEQEQHEANKTTTPSPPTTTQPTTVPLQKRQMARKSEQPQPVPQKQDVNKVAAVEKEKVLVVEKKVEKKAEKKEKKEKAAHVVAIKGLLSKYESSDELRKAVPGGATAILTSLGIAASSKTYNYLRRAFLVKYGRTPHEIYGSHGNQVGGVKVKTKLPDGLAVTISTSDKTATAAKIVEHVSMYKALDASKKEIEATTETLRKRKRHLESLEQERHDYKRALQTLEDENRDLRAKLQVQSLFRVS